MLKAMAFPLLVAFAPVAMAEQFITEIETVETPAEVLEQIRQDRLLPRPHSNRDGIDLGSIDFGQIMNLGQQVWQIIVDNQPVTDITYNYATALPRGVTSAQDLDNFSDLQTSSKRIRVRNWLGATAYDVTYTLVHQYNGDLAGKGKYLATVSVIPSNVNVSWGWNLDMDVSNVSTLNVGSADAPVGSLVMEMSLKASTQLHDHVETSLFHFRGDSPTVRSVTP